MYWVGYRRQSSGHIGKIEKNDRFVSVDTIQIDIWPKYSNCHLHFLGGCIRPGEGLDSR